MHQTDFRDRFHHKLASNLLQLMSSHRSRPQSVGGALKGAYEPRRQFPSAHLIPIDNIRCLLCMLVMADEARQVTINMIRAESATWLNEVKEYFH
jgi:hypothetical protein